MTAAASYVHRVRPRTPNGGDISRIKAENPSNHSLCPRTGQGEVHARHEHEYIWDRVTGAEVHGYTCVGVR